MSFWLSSTGETIKGQPEKAFTPEVVNIVIPNNTLARAKIVSFVLVEEFNQQYYDAPYYEITWELIDGDFVNAQVKQKIKAFEREPKTKDRALEMLMLLYRIANMAPPQSAPTAFDLLPFLGKVFGIKVKEWQRNGNEGNFVGEVHLPDNSFKTKTGVKLAPKAEAKQPLYADNFSSYETIADKKEKDIPF